MVRARQQPAGRSASAQGQLLARPQHSMPGALLGLHPLRLDAARDGFLYIPTTYDVDRPLPLVLMLHGASGNAQHALALLQQLADTTGCMLLAPDSRRQTWDVILDEYGPDIAFIDRTLDQMFSHYAVDPTHLAIGGFSDGASYALSVGITNGDLFTHIIAFSPGFMVPARQEGMPHVYVSHGTHDEVLPIAHCSRLLVPQLQRAGYDVRYHEFDGYHTVPPEIAREGMEWFLAK